MSNLTKGRRTLSTLILSASTLAALTYGAEVLAQDGEQIQEEEVTVTGIRQSLQAAADLKRNDTRIVDAVVAEDIGKLPDNNIAEALQRITGVSINTDFGVGTNVSIRGLSQNRVELNGRSTIGDGRDGVSLDDFPSSFLKTVEVVKSPTANMIEGALGGTVNMKTVRPLELKDFTAAGSFDFEYADKTENWAPIFNGSVGNNWDLGDAGSFGASFMVSYQDRELRQDEFFNRVRVYDKSDAVDGSVPEDAISFDANTVSGGYVVRDQNTVEQYVEQRERTAMNVSLQWAPASEAGNFYLDVATTDRSGSQAGVSILDVGGSRAYDENTTQDGNGQINNYQLTDVFVIPKSRSTFRSTQSMSSAIGGEWNFTDTLKVSGEVAFSESESENPFVELALRPINKADFEADGSINTHVADATYVQNGEALPSITYSGVNQNPLLDDQNLALRNFQATDEDTTNDELAIRVDAELAQAFDIDWLTLTSGLRLTESNYTFNKSEYYDKDAHKNLYYLNDDGELEYDADGNILNDRAMFWIDDFDANYGGIKTVSYDNSFVQTGLSGRNDLLTYRVYDPAAIGDREEVFAKWQYQMNGTNWETNGTLASNMEDKTGEFRDITEETSALYVMGDMDFDTVRVNAGFRYITTDITSKDYDGNKGSNSYTDLLPSVNVTWDVAEDTMLRAAAAKVMRRAGFDQLSPAAGTDNSVVYAQQGAIDIDPYRATQYDVSVEHYFGNANMVSFALYYKDVASFFDSYRDCVADSYTIDNQNVTEFYNVCQLEQAGVTNVDIVNSSNDDFASDPDVVAGTITTDEAGQAYVESLRNAGLTGIDTSHVVNGESGWVKGFELGYQQIFDFLPGALSGLGINANYTYADSQKGQTLEQRELGVTSVMEDISKHTLNTQLFWEYEGWQVRFAYNYRSDFLDTVDEKRVQNIGVLANGGTDDPTAGNNYRDDRGQLDFSASYEINDNVTVAANITNLNGANSVFVSELGSPWMYTEADRRMTIGLRAKF